MMNRTAKVQTARRESSRRLNSSLFDGIQIAALSYGIEGAASNEHATETGGGRTPIELFVTGVEGWEPATTQLVQSLESSGSRI